MARSGLALLEPRESGRFEDPDLQAFSEFVSFFRVAGARPGFLEQVACNDQVRASVPRHFRRVFGADTGVLAIPQFRWFRRLQPLLRLPRGSTILDYGSGYGLDSVFLASRGYSVVLFENTLSQLAVAEHFARRWHTERGAIDFRSILRDRSGFEPFGHVDAVLLDEIAHQVEPVESVFAKCATILERGGRVFLLEPNGSNPRVQAYYLRRRGLRLTLWRTDDATGERILSGNGHIRLPSVWNRIARRCGFQLERQEHVVPFALSSERALRSPLRKVVETTRGLRSLVATDVVSVYRRRV